MNQLCSKIVTYTSECRIAGYYIRRQFHIESGQARWLEDWIPCPVGTYSETPGHTVRSCSACPPGHTTPRVGSTRDNCGEI